MTYFDRSSVQVGAWAEVDADSGITYDVLPDSDLIEFILGDRNGLQLSMSEGGLRHCIATFTEALTAFEAAAASDPDATLPADPVPPAHSQTDQVG